MIVVDNFLDSSMYLELSADTSFFPETMGLEKRIASTINSYHDEKSDCYAPYMFWDGWWRSPANTLKKKVIQKIWESNLPCLKEDILGIEYWTRTFSPGQYLGIHVDEDTFLYEKNKTFSGPILGSIYYGINNDDGGFMEIHKSILIDGSYGTLESESIKNAASPPELRERIAYKGNRLIIFDAGHMFHETTPAKAGVRQVMVTNLWHKDNPPLAIDNGSFIYE